jgi:hypothetical protein
MNKIYPSITASALGGNSETKPQTSGQINKLRRQG